MRHAGIVWLAAGLGCLASGAALALSLSFEAGAALALLGAGAIGAGAMARVRGAAPDPDEMAELERRLDELRGLDARLSAAGVSPVERTYDELLRRRPDTPTSPATLDEQERRLGEMIRDRCDRVWEGIGDRRYVRREDGRVVDLDGGAIFAELRDVVQEVAGLYHAGSDNAVLEARTGDIALAVRSAVGELLEAVRQVPFVDPAGWSVKTVVTQLEQAQQGLALYRKLEPWEHYVNGALLAARLASGSNPVGVVAWTLGTQVAKRLGKRFVKSRAEVWLKTLLESSVALVYLRVARIYDPCARTGAPTGSPSSRPSACTRASPGSTTTGGTCSTASCAHPSPTSSRRWPCCGRSPTTAPRRRRRSPRSTSTGCGRPTGRRWPSASPTCCRACTACRPRRRGRRSRPCSAGCPCPSTSAPRAP